LGEAPEGWSPFWDVRYVTWGTVGVTLHLLVIIFGAAFWSPDPWAFLGNTGIAISLALTALLVLFTIAYRYGYVKARQSMKLARNFRVKDTRMLSDELFSDLPRQFYPVGREDKTAETFHQGEDNQNVTYVLAEHDDVLMTLDVNIKHDRHFVEVVVATSDVNSHETRDLLSGLVEFFDERTMDWLSVDVVEDINLLDSMGNGPAETSQWEVPASLSARRWGLGVWAGFVLSLWLCIGLSIADPKPNFVMALAIVGIVVNPVLIGIFIIFIDDHIRHRRQGVAYEFKRDFHASPWYVTAAIDEGLRKKGRSFYTRRRIDPTALVECETFDLMGNGSTPVTIDVAWDDHDDDPNWTVVRIRTAGEVDNIQAIKDLVRRSVFERDV